MDSLTQIVLGGAVAELVAGKKMGNKAILWGAIAGTIPDLDVFFRAFYEPLDAALIHRGFSHSILFALIASPLFAYVLTKAYRAKYEYKTWLSLFFFGIITHPMLDMFTNYGTQFFWPLDARISFNTVFVIDPFYTIPFLICLVAVLFYNRESSMRRKINGFGLIYSCSYLLIGVIIKLSVLFTIKKEYASKGYEVNRMMVTPMPFTPFYWYALIENHKSYYVNYKSLFSSMNLEETDTLSKAIRLEHLSWKDEQMRDKLERITNGYYSIFQKNDSLILYDLRFGMSGKMTAEKINRPIMGYHLIQKDGVVESVSSNRDRKIFSHIDFHYYWKKVFGF